MRIALSETEAEKVILKKIASLKKIKKKIKVDKNEKFISSLFLLLNEIENITTENSDYFEDKSRLTFRLNVYTNVNLSIGSSTIGGFQYGIDTFHIDKNNDFITRIDDTYYEIKNEIEMKKYFSETNMILPNYIEIIKIEFTAFFDDTITKYSFLNN